MTANIISISMDDEIALLIATIQAQQPLFDMAMEYGRWNIPTDEFETDVVDGLEFD